MTARPWNKYTASEERKARAGITLVLLGVVLAAACVALAFMGRDGAETALTAAASAASILTGVALDTSATKRIRREAKEQSHG